jgi:hypothetical protein
VQLSLFLQRTDLKRGLFRCSSGTTDSSRNSSENKVRLR